MELFDTHAHLDDAALFPDLEGVIERAHANGVKYITTIGVDIATSKQAIAIANKYKGVYACVGIHPSEIEKMQPGDEQLIAELLNDPKVVGLGEIGLNWQEGVDLTEQKKYFELFLKMAYKYHKPVIIHSRDAAQETLEILQANQQYLTKGILHCYSYSAEMIKSFLKLGFYISFAGPVTFKNSKEPKRAAQTVPLDRLLIETDSPYLTPEPRRGHTNEPANVLYTGKCIAELRGLTIEELAATTCANAKAVYNIKDE